MVSTPAGELVTMELAVVAVVVGYGQASMRRSILVASVTGTTGFHDGYGKRCPGPCFYSFDARIKPLACRRLAESSMRRGVMTTRYTPTRQVKPAIEPRSYFREHGTVACRSGSWTTVSGVCMSSALLSGIPRSFPRLAIDKRPCEAGYGVRQIR